MLSTVLNWFLAGPLDRIFKTVDNSIDNQTTREQIKTDAVKHYLSAQVSILNGRGWWFPLFFLAPVGFWFASVCIYSVFWCKGCAFPQAWTVAALPAPLDEWSGVIVSSLFVGKVGGDLIARLKR